MKKFIIQTILLIIIIGTALIFLNPDTQFPALPFLPQKTTVSKLQINGIELKVEIADTRAKRNKGLGGRQALATDEGMLFVFDEPDKYPFWMKGLNFPLDFVWIRGDQVTDVLPNIQPPVSGKDESLPIYQPKEDVDKVLEVPAGTIQRLNIKAGDTVLW